MECAAKVPFRNEPASTFVCENEASVSRQVILYLICFSMSSYFSFFFCVFSIRFFLAFHGQLCHDKHSKSIVI